MPCYARTWVIMRHVIRGLWCTCIVFEITRFGKNYEVVLLQELPKIELTILAITAITVRRFHCTVSFSLFRVLCVRIIACVCYGVLCNVYRNSKVVWLPVALRRIQSLPRFKRPRKALSLCQGCNGLRLERIRLF